MHKHVVDGINNYLADLRGSGQHQIVTPATVTEDSTAWWIIDGVIACAQMVDDVLRIWHRDLMEPYADPRRQWFPGYSLTSETASTEVELRYPINDAGYPAMLSQALHREYINGAIH